MGTFVKEKIVKSRDKTHSEQLEHMRKLQAKWLKKNKPTKCPDAYMDNPYKRTALIQSLY